MSSHVVWRLDKVRKSTCSQILNTETARHGGVATTFGRYFMDFDATLERLNALKLQDSRPISSTQAFGSQHAEQTAQLQHEVWRLQEENKRRVLEQEQQMQRWQQEMRAMQTRIEASEHQNRLLKAAQGEVNAYRHQTETQELVIEELQTQVKQLRITNYRLQYMVQQNDPRGQGSFLPPPPPDIF